MLQLDEGVAPHRQVQVGTESAPDSDSFAGQRERK